MKLWVLSLAVLAVPAAALAGTKAYSVEPFERISVAAGITADVSVGPAQRVVAETEGENFDDLAVSVRNGTLFIDRPWRAFWLGWAKRSYTVTVSVPQLHGVSASSGGSVSVAGPVSGDSRIDVSSSGDADLAEVDGGLVVVQASSSGSAGIHKLRSTVLNVGSSSSGSIEIGEADSGSILMEVSSSGSVEAGGTCEKLNVAASSSGEADASGLRCDSVQVQASSGGDVSVFAIKSADANASSGGDIVIGGNPPVFNKNQSSGGSITSGKDS